MNNLDEKKFLEIELNSLDLEIKSFPEKEKTTLKYHLLLKDKDHILNRLKVVQFNITTGVDSEDLPESWFLELIS